MTKTAYHAERQRLLALFELGQLTELEHARRLRAVNNAEARFIKNQPLLAAKAEAKREQNRRWYHRVKLKNQLLRSLAQDASP